MSMFQKLTGEHPRAVFPEDSETILSLFARQEDLNLPDQNRLDSDTRDCDDLLHGTSMVEFGQETKCE
jgi:hypothetical protein